MHNAPFKERRFPVTSKRRPQHHVSPSLHAHACQPAVAVGVAVAVRVAGDAALLRGLVEDGLFVLRGVFVHGHKVVVIADGALEGFGREQSGDFSLVRGLLK